MNAIRSDTETESQATLVTLLNHLSDQSTITVKEQQNKPDTIQSWDLKLRTTVKHRLIMH